MPKKSAKSAWGNRGGWANNSEDKHHIGHDDGRMEGRLFDNRLLLNIEHDNRLMRMEGRLFGNRPRVSFKPQPRPSRDVPRNAALAHLEDDRRYNSNNNNSRPVIIRGRGRGLSRGRNSPLPHRGYPGGILPRPQHPLGEANWYKIMVPYGQKYTKDYVLSILLSYMSPETFVPIMYKVIGNDAIFYVDDQKTANSLLNCDRQITTTDGFKLQVRVKPGYPQCEINDKLKEKLKLAMAKRYVQENNALDLSRFHHDPDLVTDYFCSLFQPVMLMAVLDIVSEHIPTLEALNLDGNKLHAIVGLNVLHKKFSKLKILYIGDNKIKEINQLDVVKDLKLEELRLAGNPVCNKYKARQNDYISDVRQRFPKLLRLDGIELPRPIVFDVVGDTSKVPPTQRIFASDTKMQEVASQFLQQYFMIFDSDNRQPLLNAYDEHACFSLTIHSHSSTKLNTYLLENRNLFRINDANKRQKLLKQGRLPILLYISEMPRTRHHLDTFTMDINLVSEGIMLITVTGLFKEFNAKDEFVRYFNRTFIIVPKGSGYCILNEQLHMNNPTEMQQKMILKSLETEMSELSENVYPSIPETSNSNVETTVSQLSDDVKQQMTLTLSQQTNMNLEWSLKCLQEVQWNYENAVSAFQEFFKKGQIPSEAFTK